MKLNLVLKSRDDSYYAEGVYDNGKLIVKKGSKIRLTEVSTFKKTKIVEVFRKNSKIISDNIVLCDVEFSSPSTAAQFVTNASTNGYTSWKTKHGVNLKNVIKNEKNREVLSD